MDEFFKIKDNFHILFLQPAAYVVVPYIITSKTDLCGLNDGSGN